MTENEMLEVLTEVGSRVPMTDIGRLIWLEIVNKAPAHIVAEAEGAIAASRMDVPSVFHEQSILGA